MKLKRESASKLNFLIGDDSYKAEHQFLNIALILGSFFFLFFVLINIYFQIDFVLGLIKMAGVCTCLTLFYFSRFKRIYSWTSNVFFILLLACFFFIGIRNGGVTGGIAPIYTAVLALMLFITNGKSLTWLFVLWVTSITGLFLLEFIYPEFIRPYFSRNQKYLDLYLSYASGIGMIAMVVMLVKKLYLKEKLNLEEMMVKYRNYNSDIKKSISINKESLSIREREICELVLLGLTNNEIADKLFIAEGTVKCHINNIYKKLGAKKRVEVLDFY
jgi:DNA-binding CsgD family transcriptional regulator